MAGVGSHANTSSNGSFGGLKQRNYDSSGDFDPKQQQQRYPAARNAIPPAPSLRALAMQQQQQMQGSYQPYQHRRDQGSDDFDSHGQMAAYNTAGGPYNARADGGYTPSTARLDRDRGREAERGEVDSSFDYLLSPGLAPVGPISASSSLSPLNASNMNQQQQQSHLGSSMLSPSATTPTRPSFGRSQTAMPAASTSGRSFQAPQAYRDQQQYNQPMYGLDNAASSGLISSLGPSGSGHAHQGSAGHTGRDYAPPPPISSSALLDIVRKMKADQPGSAQASSSSSAMSRSQSANASARLQQSSNLPAHMRNVSTGSNKSDDDTGGAMTSSTSGLIPPSFPGMSRTASSKNVTDSIPSSSSSLRTIDLTHHRIAEVPSEVIDSLAGSVAR